MPINEGTYCVFHDSYYQGEQCEQCATERALHRRLSEVCADNGVLRTVVNQLDSLTLTDGTTTYRIITQSRGQWTPNHGWKDTPVVKIYRANPAYVDYFKDVLYPPQFDNMADAIIYLCKAHPEIEKHYAKRATENSVKEPV